KPLRGGKDEGPARRRWTSATHATHTIFSEWGMGNGELNSFRIPHSESHAPTFQTYVRIFGAGFDVSLRHYQHRVMANGVQPLNHERREHRAVGSFTSAQTATGCFRCLA